MWCVVWWRVESGIVFSGVLEDVAQGYSQADDEN